MFIRLFIFLVVGFWIWLTTELAKRARRVQPARVRPDRPRTGRWPGDNRW
jgi:hypothetical protein